MGSYKGLPNMKAKQLRLLDGQLSFDPLHYQTQLRNLENFVVSYPASISCSSKIATSMSLEGLHLYTAVFIYTPQHLQFL